MRLKKKAISLFVTIAMVLSLVSPLAAAAASDAKGELASIINNVHAKLIGDEEDDVYDVYDGGIPAGAIDPVWDVIEGKGGLVAGDESAVSALIGASLLLPYAVDEVNDVLDDFYSNHSATIEKLVAASGLTGPAATVAWTDLTAFATALEAAVTSELADLGTIASLVGALDDASEFAEELDVVLANAFSTVLGNSSLKVSQVYAGLGIIGDQIIEVRNNVLSVNDSDNAGTKALGLAFLRSKAALSATSTSSNSLNAGIKILGQTVPANFIEWTVESGKRVSTPTESDNYFRFSGTGASGSVAVTATETVTDTVIYTGSISFNYNPSSDVPVVPTTPVVDTTATDAAAKNLAELSSNLDTLSPAEKKAALADAGKEVTAAIKAAATVEVTSKVTDGKATTTPNNNDIVNTAKAAKEQADALNKELEAAGGQPAKVELTIDLGTVDAVTAEIPLDAELLKAMADAGIDSVAVKMNGVEISIDPRELPDGATLHLSTRPGDEAKRVTTNKVVSEVYDFEYVTDGRVVQSFTNPVVLRLPVNADALDDADTGLFTVGKIVNNPSNDASVSAATGVVYYNGDYNAATQTVDVKRNGLSSYFVVENKVSFNDTASVKSWAGRAIDVSAAKSIIVGDGKGNFNPTSNVTRAEFVKMLVSTFSLNDSSAKESFIDVRDEQWFSSYIKVAVSMGIIDDSRGAFNPNSAITREDMAQMVGRLLQSQLGADAVADVDQALRIFKDNANVSADVKSDVAVTVSEGIIVGSNGSFNPTGNTTRAEAAVVIKKLIDLL